MTVETKRDKFVRLAESRMDNVLKGIDLIGNLHSEDFKDTSIVSFDSECPYWRKPSRLLSDLGDSGWKGAFLKKMGVLFPFFLSIYFL